MADPTTTASPSTANSNLVISSHPIALKLNEENYLLWKQQVLAAIRGHNLQQYIVSSSSIPPQFLSLEDEVLGTLNPEFLAWEQKDQLLLSWLLSSLSEPMLTRFVGCNQSRQLWDQIHQHFHSQARSKVRQYRSELWNIKKGSCTVNEYLLRIKALVDSLTFAGKPISTQEHIEIILDGLPEEYNSFITAITTRRNPCTLPEIESLLFDCEARLDQRRKDTASDSFSANVAHNQSSEQPVSSNPFTAPPGFHAAGFACFGGYRAPFTPSRGGRFGNLGPQGRGGRSGGPRAAVCNVCGRPGHEAAVCYHHRYDLIFQPPSGFQPSTPQRPGGFSTPCPPSQHQFQPQFHPPTLYPSSSAYPQPLFPGVPSPSRPSRDANPMRAMLATPEVITTQMSYPDSGANHHVTWEDLDGQSFSPMANGQCV